MSQVIRVETAAGALQGEFCAHGGVRFLAIPYAEALTPARRLRAPLPRRPWAGLRPAVSWGAAAPQESPDFLGIGAWDEDCLHLNVWSPDVHGRRAVMVWIHGGGYWSGSNAQRLYDAESLTRQQDVVVVSVNYRLGLAGFGDWRAYPELAADSNCGLRDLLLALQWVQTNIAGFGGDPTAVTLFGESAGGMAVATLLAVPAARSLFHRAIVQSGSADHVYRADVAQRVSADVCAVLAAPRQLQEMSWPEWLRLQRSSLRRLLPRGLDAVPLMQYGMPALPYIDDDLLTQTALTADLDERPLLIGSTRDEWSLFLYHPELLGGRRTDGQVYGEEDWRALVQRGVPERAALLAPAYEDALPGQDAAARMILFESDRIFTMSSLRLAERIRDHAWVYRMDWPCAGLRRLGACHIVDLPFVFATLETPLGQFFAGPGEAARRLSTLMQDHWGHFARQGRPGADWPAYGESAWVQVFAENSHLEQDPYRWRRQIWRQCCGW